MSEIQKPVEEVVAVVEAAPAEVVAAPVEEVAPVEVAPVEVAAATTEEATAEAAVETPKKEFEGEGVIGYKAPGGFIKKLAGFQKRFFWFGTDAVEVKSLSNYLRGEKPEAGNHNAAWASQTGKGLLYFSKQAGEKSAPVGLINLADITDIKEDGTVEFSFVSHSQKHVFQAANLVDRDSWVAALKEKSVEAKESTEAITGSEGYKEQLASLSKPVVVAAKVEDKKEEKAVAAEETKPEEVKEVAKEETKEEKKARTKSRSASRKRNSIFGGFNLGSKKEEVVVADKAVTEEEPVAEAAPVEAAVVEEAAAPVEAAATEAAVVEEAVVPETRPAASKRHSSLFDFKSRFGSKKATSEVTPAVPAKDDEVVTSTEAPVIPAVEQSEPLATSIASPATVPAEEVVAGEPVAEVAPEATKAEKRKSALPFGLGQKKEKVEKALEAEVEKAEKSLSPFAKLRQTVKGKASPKAAEKAAETEAETPAATEAAAETTVEAAAEEPVVAAPIQTTTPVVSATA
ncbi:hypothetical protein V499_02502 [Pseudogymnoascus sp. VKM F-103]|uniref:Meiotic expression up-regulated protein 6 PH domain-containing protein n=1 Tax=Pseudogymnoascus verrucosus TaxID=342668 RepID=A0A1B8GKP5_9PEZI|nr:uncharacterized protein VE01_05727 [Pseudogymnoascus verrucosus]KFY78329.1 hypothetical protein V499_02502 [Pseudogymnoascus sp. VKM F-103]OBT96419.1 hypothetical protein VE01_05727 [Pseudogymnoascus verrucosus]